MLTVHVLQITEGAARSRLCEKILRSLPEWFGIESAVQEYVRGVAALPTFGAWLSESGEAVGFLSLKLHNEYAAEIYVMAVMPRSHGRGLGTALVDEAERFLRDRSVEYLQVKTLGPSRPSAEYARTRRFYESRGFRPLEELHGLWGEGNPTLILVKRLSEPRGDRR